MTLRDIDELGRAVEVMVESGLREREIAERLGIPEELLSRVTGCPLTKHKNSRVGSADGAAVGEGLLECRRRKEVGL